MDIKIGMRYIKRGDKQNHVRTVEDIHKTYNNAGSLITTTYRCSHVFCGQTVYENGVVQPTIAIGRVD